jgi:hypothetical protein
MRTETRLVKVLRIILVGVVAALASGTGEAFAQQMGRRPGMGGGNAGGLPFSGTYRRPSVSPYQQLSNFSNNPQAAANLYQSLVQPAQLQQQQQIEQLSQSRAIGRLQNQVQSIQRDTRGRQVDESIRPTGHRATYMNYSHYYGGQ